MLPEDDDDALPAGTRFGELEILRVLGIGGFGIVYLAQDHALERRVALKEYMPGSLAGRNGGRQVSVRSESHAQTYAVGLRSFVNEARLLARFNHPSLVKVYRFWEENGTAYMVMPLIEGRTLRDVRRSMTGAPGQAWIVGVMRPLLDALEQLHREGVYHRDIAPDNILLPPGELPVLLDFGAARRAIGDRTQTFTAILKPSYAPIEQYAESSAMRQGPWTDLYALGAVVYYLLIGSPPPPATARALHEEDRIEWGELPADVTPEFLATVEWMLAIRPGDRPQSAAELRAVLDGRAAVPERAERAPDTARETAFDETLVLPRPSVASDDPEATRVMPRREVDVEPMTGYRPAAPVDDRLPPSDAKYTTLRDDRPTGSRRGLWFVMLACALLLAALAGLMLLADRSGRRSDATVAPGVDPAASAASTPEVAVAPAEPASTASEPVAAVEPPVIASQATEPASRASAAARPRDRVTRTASASAASAATIADVVPEAPKPEPRHRATEPAAAASAVAPGSPREACGDRFFLAMDICMEERCHEPRFANHPQCVPVRAIEERRKRNDY